MWKSVNSEFPHNFCNWEKETIQTTFRILAFDELVLERYGELWAQSPRKWTRLNFLSDRPASLRCSIDLKLTITRTSPKDTKIRDASFFFLSHMQMYGSCPITYLVCGPDAYGQTCTLKSSKHRIDRDVIVLYYIRIGIRTSRSRGGISSRSRTGSQA